MGHSKREQPLERIATLDIVRGVAVMGIFAANVILFAMISAASLNPGAFGGHRGADLAVWLANFVFVDGKFRSLFSILFGASMLLVIERAEASGQSPAAVHYRRMIVLLFLGLIHFYVVWHGDILTLYALVGMIGFLFRKRRTKTLLIWAMGLFAFLTIGAASTTIRLRNADLAAHSPHASTEQVEYWNGLIGVVSAHPAADERETRAMRERLPERVRYMLAELLMAPLRQFGSWGLSTLGLMLVGMAGYRSGFLTGAWPDRRYQHIAAATLVSGGLTSLAIALWIMASSFYLPLLFFGGFAFDLIHLAMALGYASLFILLTRRNGWFAQRLAATGRAALTNYLGTSILAALIFYGDGLSLFGHLSRFQAWLFVPLFWLLMLAWSKPWLDRFAYGPFEWLWRSLSRWQLQPMKRGAGEVAAAS